MKWNRFHQKIKKKSREKLNPNIRYVFTEISIVVPQLIVFVKHFRVENKKRKTKTKTK